MNKSKIGTWNLCLGLANKKDLIKQTLTKNEIDICCLQETEIVKDYPENLLIFPGYSLELEKNDLKTRVGMYVSKTIRYKRRKDLEGLNNHLVIIDILDKKDTRLINILASMW